MNLTDSQLYEEANGLILMKCRTPLTKQQQERLTALEAEFSKRHAAALSNSAEA